MKAKVIIEDGITTIELIAEGSFEKEMVECYAYEKETTVNWRVYPDYDEGYGVKSKHKIVIVLSKIPKTK